MCNAFFFCRQYTDDVISMQVHKNDSSFFRVHVQAIVTHGEWALKNIRITLKNETRNKFSKSIVVYTVRKHLKSSNSLAFAAPVSRLTTFLMTVSDHNGQETSSLCGQFHCTPLLPVGPRRGLLLHQRSQGGKARF